MIFKERLRKFFTIVFFLLMFFYAFTTFIINLIEYNNEKPIKGKIFYEDSISTVKRIFKNLESPPIKEIKIISENSICPFFFKEITILNYETSVLCYCSENNKLNRKGCSPYNFFCTEYAPFSIPCKNWKKQKFCVKYIDSWTFIEKKKNKLHCPKNYFNCWDLICINKNEKHCPITNIELHSGISKNYLKKNDVKIAGKINNKYLVYYSSKKHDSRPIIKIVASLNGLPCNDPRKLSYRFREYRILKKEENGCSNFGKDRSDYSLLDQEKENTFYRNNGIYSKIMNYPFGNIYIQNAMDSHVYLLSYHRIELINSNQCLMNYINYNKKNQYQDLENLRKYRHLFIILSISICSIALFLGFTIFFCLFSNGFKHLNNVLAFISVINFSECIIAIVFSIISISLIDNIEFKNPFIKSFMSNCFRSRNFDNAVGLIVLLFEVNISRTLFYTKIELYSGVGIFLLLISITVFQVFFLKNNIAKKMKSSISLFSRRMSSFSMYLRNDSIPPTPHIKEKYIIIDDDYNIENEKRIKEKKKEISIVRPEEKLRTISMTRVEK